MNDALKTFDKQEGEEDDEDMEEEQEVEGGEEEEEEVEGDGENSARQVNACLQYMKRANKVFYSVLSSYACRYKRRYNIISYVKT